MNRIYYFNNQPFLSDSNYESYHDNDCKTCRHNCFFRADCCCC